MATALPPSPLTHIAGFYAVLGLVWLVRLLPEALLDRLAWLLGRGVYLAGVRRKVMRENLDRCFPEETKAWKQRIMRDQCVNFIRNQLRYVKASGEPVDAVGTSTELRNPEVLNEAHAEGNGVVLVSGHLGNWELMAGRVVWTGFPFTILVSPIKNHYLDAYITRLRRRWNFEPLPRGMAAKGLFKALRQNRIIGILMDQDARRHGIFVPFFGQPASTIPSPAVYALKTGAAMVFCQSHHEAGRHIVTVSRVPIEDALRADPDEGAYVLTARLNGMLEEAVRAHPDEYFWMHRRFKSTPEPGDRVFGVASETL